MQTFEPDSANTLISVVTRSQILLTFHHSSAEGGGSQHFENRFHLFIVQATEARTCMLERNVKDVNPHSILVTGVGWGWGVLPQSLLKVRVHMRRCLRSAFVQKVFTQQMCRLKIESTAQELVSTSYHLRTVNKKNKTRTDAFRLLCPKNQCCLFSVNRS